MSTATLHNEMKKTLVPQLRFQEFDGEWKKCLLNDVTKYVKGFAFKSEDYQENGVRIVRVSDLSTDRIKSENEKVYIDESKSKLYDKYKLNSGNIIITTVGSKPEMIESAVGRGIYIHNDNEGLLNQNMLKFENIKNVDNGYIIGLINSKRYQHYMKSIARGNANQSNITVVDLLQYQVTIPTLPEQQKIASFLSTVDKKIQQLTRKATLLEHYKKGVMQQLFSGKLRFKDENGEDYPDWEEKKLGEVLKIGSGKDYKHLEKGSIPVFGTGGYMLSVNKFLHSGETVFIGRKGTIDKPFYFNGDFWTVDTLFYTHTFKNVIPKFIYCVFQQINWKLHNEASGVPSLSKSTIEKLKFKFPRVDEQQKIADFLSGIDSKIEKVNQQLAQTQMFKKGLLQQLFV